MEHDPKQPIEGRQNTWPASFIEGGELQPRSSILEGNGLRTDQQQSNESNEGQEKSRHVCMLLHISVFGSVGIMANHKEVHRP